MNQNTYFQHWTKCRDCSQSKLTENAEKKNNYCFSSRKYLKFKQIILMFISEKSSILHGA